MSTAIYARISPALHRDVVALAAQQHRTISSLVGYLLRQEVEKTRLQATTPEGASPAPPHPEDAETAGGCALGDAPRP